MNQFFNKSTIIKILVSLSVIFTLNACTSESNESDDDKDTLAGDSSFVAKDSAVIYEGEYVATGEEVSYETDSVTLKGYYVKPPEASEKVPGVLVFHEWWGHNKFVREKAEELAELGYAAFAVDMYGEGKTAEHPKDAMKFSSMVMNNFDLAKIRFEAALKTLKAYPEVDTSKIGAIGFCFGGTTILGLANAGYDLEAVAAFHSGMAIPVLPEKGERIKPRIVIMNGADDPFVKKEEVAEYTAAMEKTNADFEYITYEDTKHGFTNPNADSLGKKFELPLAYNKDAAEKSWDKMKELFDNSFE